MAPPESERPNFHVTLAERGGSSVVALAGELDLATAGDAATVIRERLGDGPVLLDLRELEFMDSSGMHMLDAVARDAEREGWTLRVDPEMRVGVWRALELTGLLETLPLADREQGTP